MSIATVNAIVNENGTCALVWGDDGGTLYLTSELPPNTAASLPANYSRAEYTADEIASVVDRARHEMGLASVPDAHGGPCIFI